MGCNSIKNRCFSETFATCVRYELDVPTFSNIKDKCKSIEDTTKDLYELVGEVKENIDLSDLGNKCLNYTEVGGKKLVRSVLLKYEQEICDLKDKVKNLESGSSICNKSIEGCGINFGTLEDECGNPINTLGEALQAIVDKINI